jgi:pilus assembly protein CpaE
MQAGVRDFLTKPPSIEDLTAAVRRAGKMAQDEKAQTPNSTGPSTPLTSRRGTGKIISIYSPKGGTGCTTIATNLAIAMNSEENPTVLLEANLLYGDVAVLLNEQVKNSVYDLTPRVDELDAEVVHNVAVKHSASGLHVLPAPPKAEWANEITAEQFSKLLDYLRDVYAFIIVDTAPYLTEVVQAALEISDTIVLITTQDIPSIKNCGSFLSLSDASGIKRNRILFIMNRYDKRNNVSPERVGETLRQPIQITIPLDEKVVHYSITRGMPFILDNKNQPVSKGIFELADLIQTRFTKGEDSLPSGRK